MCFRSMKNKGKQLALTLAVGVIAANFASGATDANRSALETVYSKYTKALKEKDARTVSSYETDDFTIELSSGETLNRQQADALLKQTLGSLKTISNAGAQITDVKTENGTATVSVTETMTATMADSQGREHVISATTKSRDVWVKIDEKWRIKSSKVLEDKSTLDGKAVH